MATTVSGNTSINSPYNGNEPMTITRTGVPQGEWVEFNAPTNTVTTVANGVEITQEVLGWVQAGADGKASLTWNASPTEGIVQRTVLYGWVLAAGTYQITTRLFSDKTNASIESANFQIIGTATAAITAAIKNRKKK